MKYVVCPTCGKVLGDIEIPYEIKSHQIMISSELTEEDWKIYELKNPYGAYRIQVFNRFSTQCGSLENEEQYNELKKTIEEDVQVEFCSVSRLIDGHIVEQMIKTTTKQ